MNNLQMLVPWKILNSKVTKHNQREIVICLKVACGKKELEELFIHERKDTDSFAVTEMVRKNSKSDIVFVFCGANNP